jgi:hypothetical protein
VRSGKETGESKPEQPATQHDAGIHWTVDEDEDAATHEHQASDDVCPFLHGRMEN